MSKKVLLKKLMLENWQQFREASFEFSVDKKKKNITFIQGQNGTGKTTLFDAIYYVLFNHLPPYNERKIETYPNKDALEKGEEIETRLEIEFEIEEFGRIQQYKIRRILNFVGKSPDTQLLTNKKDSDYYRFDIDKNGWIKQSEVSFISIFNSVIPEQSRDFYFVDGEKIKTLFQKGARDSIKSLSLKMSDVLKIDLMKKYVVDCQKHVNKSLDAKTKKKTKYQETLDKIEKNRDKLEPLKEELEKKNEIKGDLEESINQTNLRLSDIINNPEKVNLIQQHNKEIDKSKKERGILEGQLGQLMIEFYPLLILEKTGIFDWIQNYLDDLRKNNKIPAPIDRSIIEHILHDKKCICGRELDTESKNVLDELLDKIPTDSLNIEIKNYSSKLVEKRNKLPEKKKEIKKINQKIIDLENRISSLVEKKRIIELEINSGERSSEELANLHNLEEELRNVKNLIEATEQNIASNKKLDKSLNMKLKQFKTEGSKFHSDPDLMKVDALNSLEKLYQFASDLLKDKVRLHIAQKTSEYFKKIIWDQDFWKGIEIDEEWNYQIKDRSGKIFQNLSAGQFHVLGISFMGALTEITDLQIPFVFDSPFGRIDSKNTEQIGQNLPIMMNGSQIILFVTDVEANSILPSISTKIGKKYRIVKEKSDLSKLEEF